MMGMLTVALMGVLLIAAGCGSSPAPSPANQTIAFPTSTPAQGIWHEQTVLAFDHEGFIAAEKANGLVVGDQTSWVELKDGRWMPAEAVNQDDRLGITSWHGSLIAWADGGVILISRDGLALTDAVSGPGESNPVTIAPFADSLLLLGEGASRSVGAWQSADGSTWTPNDKAPTGLKAAATFQGHGLVAVGWTGPDATAWSTTDTRTWTLAGLQPTGASSTLRGVAASGKHVVAIGDIDGSAAVRTSDDFVSWRLSGTAWGEDAYLSSVIDLDGAFVIAGRRGDRPVVWRSPDGLSWTSFDLPAAQAVKAEAVHMTIQAGRLVAFGYSNQDAGNGGSFHAGYLVWTLDYR